MGRDQELRDAARDGNIPKLESFLSGKRGSIMLSLRRALNINCQDENGNTPLHLAALNGRSQAAVLLLQNDASANIPDASGNYPLHLAAFNGHSNVIEILINHGPSRANVLEQNSSFDTALHIASQYGHTKVVNILLECHADPHMRNKKGESPLDLAAMYGRLSTVQILVISDKSLSRDHCRAHSPLHLAARNGHTAVLEALLDAGMSVDTMCERGSALHEAALFGKIDAVKLLLNRGIDVGATNEDGSTVLDLLVDLPSERSQEITALIYEQTQMMMNAGQQRSKTFSITSQSSPGSVPKTVENSDESFKEVSRSASVSQRKMDAAYTLVQYPRLSKVETNFLNTAISPSPEDSSTQGDIFNDNFLRQMKSTPLEESEQPMEEDRNSLEQKRPVVLNVYENMEPPDDRNSTDSVSPMVPLSRIESGISQSNRDSVPAFPPPSSDEAIRTLQNLIEIDTRPGGDENPSHNRAAKGPRDVAVYENVSFEYQRNGSDQPGGLSRVDGGVYDNVVISNKALEPDQRKTADPPSVNRKPEEPNMAAESARRASGVKQNRISRSSTKEASSRPASTLNESYEWSKIDKIFSSFEDLIHCDPLAIDEGVEENSVSPGDWLSRLGLSHYEAAFVANGYDDVRYLGDDMLDGDDLREIGIQKADHIREILKSASSLPSPPQIGVGEYRIPESVHEWLEMISLPDYESRFFANGYESMDRIRAIWEFELTTVIGIHLSGHRKRMVYSLGRRPENDREKISWSQKFAAAEAPRAAMPSSNDDAMTLANQLLKEAEDMALGFEKRQADKDDRKMADENSETPKSPTSPKILKYQPSFQWIHKPETLLYANVSYPTQYLGSHPVMVVRGTESTVEACKKMKSTSQMLQKVPTIHLGISVRGIDFIDAQSSSTISSYDIRYISYCAQDPDDLSVFAYITKDPGTSKHYCHVFKGSNLKLADEIVLTIGQAFELAYHQHRLLIEGKRSSSDDIPETPIHECNNELQSKDDRRADPPPRIPNPYASSRQFKQELPS